MRTRSESLFDETNMCYTLEPLMPKYGEPWFLSPFDTDDQAEAKQLDYQNFINLCMATEHWRRNFRNEPRNHPADEEMFTNYHKPYGEIGEDEFIYLEKIEKWGFLKLYRIVPDGEPQYPILQKHLLQIMILHPGFPEFTRRIRDRYPIGLSNPPETMGVGALVVDENFRLKKMYGMPDFRRR